MRIGRNICEGLSFIVHLVIMQSLSSNGTANHIQGGLRSRLAAYVSLDAEGEVWIDRRLIDKMFESNTVSSGAVSHS